MVVLLSILALICIAIIIYMIIDYYRNTERLTGKYYKRLYAGSNSYEIIVEVKVKGCTFTRIANQNDLKVLSTKLQKEPFAVL
jgi:hypothetical protein